MSRQEKRGGGKALEAAAFLSLIVLLWVPFFLRAAVGKSALSPALMHDVGFQWIPFRAFIAQCYREGVFPLWAPQLFAGFPFAAFSHTGVFYPLGFLLGGDYAQSVNYFYPLHLCAASAGVYVLVRRLRLPVAAAWLASFSYTFTGKPYYFVHFLPSTCSNVWIPWLLWSMLSLARQQRLRYFLLTALFFALAVLGGDIESTSYGLLFAFLFLWAVRPAENMSGRGLFLVLAAFPLAVFLAAVQLLPLQEFAAHFVRSEGVSFAYFSQRRLSAVLLSAVALPLKGAQGSAAGMAEAPYFYLGAMTLGLAGAAVLRPVRPYCRRLGILTLFAALWSAGSLSWLDRIQYSIPILNRFGSPEHAFFMVQLFLALLVAETIGALLAAGSARAILALALPGLALALFRTAASILGVPVLPAPRIFLGLAALGLAGALVQPRTAVRRRRRRVVAAILGFQLVDLYSLALLYLPATDPASFRPPKWLSELASILRPAHSRILMVSRQGLSDPELLYHAGLPLDLDSVDSWITVPLRDYAEFLALADPRAVEFQHGRLHRLGLNSELRDGRSLEASGLPLLSLLSLRYIIDRALPLKFSSPHFLFLSPPRFHKRAFLPSTSLFTQHPPEGRRPAAALELIRYNIFIHMGDRLRVPHPRLERPPGEEAACTFAVQMITAGGRQELYSFRLPGAGEEVWAGGRAEVEVFDLSPWAGEEVELEFSFRCTGGSENSFWHWSSPWIHNPERTIQAAPPGPHWPEDIILYQNREAFPRSFVVHAADVLPRKDILDRLKTAGTAELRTRIWLEREMPPGGREEMRRAAPGAGSSADRVRMISRRAGEEVYEVESRGPGFLFLSDQYYPGWQAEVSGRAEVIFRADYCFRAVPVPDGKSVVRLMYVPVSFRLGLFLTLVAGVGLMALAAWGAGRRREGSAADFSPEK